MWAFFHGWRRKAGCVTLVMALVLMTGWLRSTFFCDQFCFASGRNALEYLQNGNPSGGGVIYWNHFQGDAQSESSLSEKTFVGWNRFPKMEQLHYKPINIYPFFGGSPAFTYCGFSFSSVSSKHANGFMVCIPYWSIVIPLTLLSALLLLWPQRKREKLPQTSPVIQSPQE